MKRIPLLIVYIMLLFICLPGVSENSHFRHYNNKHGLSHNTVYCSLQDQRGFMWFGTEDGLNRFDGHTFKIYRHNSSHPNSLPNDHIGNLFESSDGKIWVFTAGGTCYYELQDRHLSTVSAVSQTERTGIVFRCNGRQRSSSLVHRL